MSDDWIETLGRELHMMNAPCGLIGEFDYIDKIRQAYATHLTSLPQLKEMAEGIGDLIFAARLSRDGREIEEIRKDVSTHLAPLYAELERKDAEIAEARKLLREALERKEPTP